MAYTKYTEAFKSEAIKLALESDANCKEISDNLGVNYKTLMGWIQKSMSDETEKEIDYKSRYQQLTNENTELRRKLKKTEMEREILKKATAYFANPNT